MQHAENGCQALTWWQCCSCLDLPPWLCLAVCPWYIYFWLLDICANGGASHWLFIELSFGGDGIWAFQGLEVSWVVFRLWLFPALVRTSVGVGLGEGWGFWAKMWGRIYKTIWCRKAPGISVNWIWVIIFPWIIGGNLSPLISRWGYELHHWVVMKSKWDQICGHTYYSWGIVCTVNAQLVATPFWPPNSLSMKCVE